MEISESSTSLAQEFSQSLLLYIGNLRILYKFSSRVLTIIAPLYKSRIGAVRISKHRCRYEALRAKYYPRIANFEATF